ncbi:hypothetical protein FY528_17795 [Hymenobacter lutimineralis]|uniref:Lipoprotein n=1 Tax=Hymenobacter lutimineralis TaxID=2606448 RepID=A0A5D6US61_9BACT|nr:MULTISPECIES: hypothetical protein [Hymenobacter]QIX60460.1 hypothetical protein HER32_04355 [Hymenobacter sp. BT18]TYZ06541.1 hypothetical protein FY528_17795 [Hymenobacter lutimineralis]
MLASSTSSSRRLLVPVFAGLLGLAGCMNSQNASETERPAAERGTAVTPGKLDVASLLKRNIDQLRRQLGQPQEASDELVGADPNADQMKSTNGEGWINTFQTEGNTLVVTFNARNRRVSDIVLVGSNEDDLMLRGGLMMTSPDYIVMPISDGGPESNKVKGIRVIPRRK